MNDLDALLADPRFTQAINAIVITRVNDIVTTRVTSALEPQLRSLANQLLLLIEVTYSGACSRGFAPPPSPLEPMLASWPQSESLWLDLCRRFPGLGNSVAAVSQNCRLLRYRRDIEHHAGAVEDVVQRLRVLAEDFSPQRLQALDPFLYAVIVSADDIVAHFLASPRLLQLAQVALQVCKTRLLDSHPERSWSWQAPDNPEKVTVFISLVLEKVPAFGSDAQEFAASADAVVDQAREFGPSNASYSREELQSRVARCLELRILQSAGARYPFAFTLITHLDTILSIDIK
ncbi:hypothetical protein Agub_g1658 [Astrephomene gubernaculifera]|uniref:Uncharacterized protein n=1 Tax=Astrephomene gubernaculifera TaxID=47775 RepID=A0AAD3DG74_9CHLO|nr:hypothetical protein Agub_g1658 [Astrephomene gubernaculifera]